MIGICSLTQAQSQDTTSTKYNEQAPTEEKRSDTKSDDMKTNDAERESRGLPISSFSKMRMQWKRILKVQRSTRSGQTAKSYSWRGASTFITIMTEGK